MTTVVKSREGTVGGTGYIDPPPIPASPGDTYRVLHVVDNGDVMAQIVTNADRGADWVGELVKAYTDKEGGGE